MRMTTLGLKGVGAAIVFYISWINQNFTPLFWVLLALITLDLILNAHKEGQQLNKIASMAISLGVPGYIAANIASPNLGKYIVAIMCLVYLQIVVPSIIGWIQSIKGGNGKTDPNTAAIQALVEKVAAMEQAQAEKVLEGSGAPEPIKEQGGK